MATAQQTIGETSPVYLLELLDFQSTDSNISLGHCKWDSIQLIYATYWMATFLQLLETSTGLQMIQADRAASLTLLWVNFYVCHESPFGILY